MGRRNGQHGLWCFGAVVVLFFGAVCCAQALAAQAVGMVTQVSGQVSYTPAEAGSPAPVKSFMKIHAGDSLTVPDNGRLQLIFFSSGRKESWQGPVVLDLSAAGGQPREESASQPQVSGLPEVVSAEVRRLAKIVDPERMKRTGAYMVRGEQGDTGEPLPEVELQKDELREVELARQTYRSLLKESAKDDIVPELFLFSVLADYDQFDAMEKLLGVMKEKQPANEEITALEEWLARQR